jgi:hypothetical protein
MVRRRRAAPTSGRCNLHVRRTLSGKLPRLRGSGAGNRRNGAEENRRTRRAAASSPRRGSMPAAGARRRAARAGAAWLLPVASVAGDASGCEENGPVHLHEHSHGKDA